MKQEELSAFTHFRFEDRRAVTVLRWNGRPAWIAQEVAELLQIERPSRVIRVLSLKEGADFEVVRGQELASLRGVMPKFGITPPRNTANLMLLFESGLYGLIFHSRTPDALRFRDHVTREVLPALRLQGFYRMPGQAAAGDWRGVLTLFAQAAGGETIAVAHLRKMGFTPEGDIPPAYRTDPGPGIVARLITLARDANRYALVVLVRGLGLTLPPELQLSLPGVEE
jgi:prophage antirepressor-like protein